MFFVLFAFWLLLNGRWTAEIALTGAAVCGLVYLFLWKYLGYSPRKEWQAARRLPGLAAYALWLVGQIVASAAATIRLIWSPRLIAEPRLVAFRSRLKTRAGRTLLANSITLTPGTITADQTGDRFLVHCLDSDFAEGLADSEMEKRILRIEEGGASRE